MKKIASKIKIIVSDISEVKTDVVVNAAKPTLMGGSGVDGAIHGKVDRRNGKDFLKNKIRLDFGFQYDLDYPRVNYGEFYETDGYGVWKKIYHAVGVKSDEVNHGTCSKSQISKLKKLYSEIFNAFEKSGFKSISIPVISAGSYGLDPKIARRVLYASTHNFLTRLRERNVDLYNYIEIIQLVVNSEEDFCMFISEKKGWSNNLKDGDELLYLSKKDSKNSYFSEIKKEKYAIVKFIKYLIYFLEYVSPIYHLSTIKNVSWNKKRQVIDFLVIGELGSVIIMLLIKSSFKLLPIWNNIFIIWIIFLIFEILLSNSKLFFYNNIVNKSANAFRSLILFIINYSTVIVSYAILYVIKGEMSIVDGLKTSVFIELTVTDKITETMMNSLNILLISEKIIVTYLPIVGLTLLFNSFYAKKFKKA